MLPWTIAFFLTFGNSIPLPKESVGRVAATVPAAGLPVFPILAGDPPAPVAGQHLVQRAPRGG